MKALNLLRKYGWIQRDLGDKTKGFCSIGAISAAYKGYKEWVKAEAKLRIYINKQYHTNNIMKWNDARVRTKQQVLGAFKAAKV